MRQAKNYLLVCTLVLLAGTAGGAELQVGFAETDITPNVAGGRTVWMAGFGHGRKATGVHDPLQARCVVLLDGTQKLALLSVDLVGLQLPTVQRVRERLTGFQYVLISSTHNHEGPDVIGIWGPTPFQRGVDESYLDLVVDRCCEAVRAAEARVFPARVEFGTATDDELLGDSREPYVKDGVLRVLRFVRSSDSTLGGLLVQWSCHPESLGSRNTLITADFPHYTVARLRDQLQCPVAYFSGAVGGLMSNPDNRVRNAAGELLRDGNFEYAERYGEEVAKLALKAASAAAPVRSTPLRVVAKTIAVPIENPIYRAARELGVLQRSAYHWSEATGELGEPAAGGTTGQSLAVASEVACLRLGDVYLAGIPGELYPELVYGRVQEPADPGADFPDAPSEPAVTQMFPDQRWLLLGLANDEIGYIIPRRQWDERPPYCYGRSKAQYGEINSCGPLVAPLVMRALANCAAEAGRDIRGR